MRIIDLIRKDLLLIIPELNATNREDVIHELASFVALHHPGLSNDEVVRVLTEREQLGSTAVGDGLAIPHAKHHSIRDHLVACLGRSRKGIDFGAPDGKRTHFFFVLIAPENEPALHLKALARISHLFKDADFRKRLMAARKAQEMYELIAAEDVE